MDLTKWNVLYESEPGAGGDLPAGAEQPEGSPSSTPAETPEGGTPEGGEPEGNLQTRFNELTLQREDAKRESQILREESAYWRGLAEAKTTPTEPKSTELDPDDFETNADYLKALGSQFKEELRTETQADTAKTALTAAHTKAREKYKDFDTVIMAPGVSISQDMFEAAAGDSFGDILYHLGKNPGDSIRIANLPATEQIKAIGALEARLKADPPKTTPTNAPNPVPNLGGGGGSPPAKTDEEMLKSDRPGLYAQWEKQRRAEG